MKYLHSYSNMEHMLHSTSIKTFLKIMMVMPILNVLTSTKLVNFNYIYCALKQFYNKKDSISLEGIEVNSHTCISLVAVLLSLVFLFDCRPEMHLCSTIYCHLIDLTNIHHYYYLLYLSSLICNKKVFTKIKATSYIWVQINRKSYKAK